MELLLNLTLKQQKVILRITARVLKNTTKTDEEIFQEKLNSSSAKWISFPTVDEIEAFEGRHKFITPNAKFIDEFYDIIKDVIGIDKRLFMKGVKVDEDSVYISGIDVG